MPRGRKSVGERFSVCVNQSGGRRYIQIIQWGRIPYTSRCLMGPDPQRIVSLFSGFWVKELNLILVRESKNSIHAIGTKLLAIKRILRGPFLVAAFAVITFVIAACGGGGNGESAASNPGDSQSQPGATAASTGAPPNSTSTGPAATNPASSNPPSTNPASSNPRPVTRRPLTQRPVTRRPLTQRPVARGQLTRRLRGSQPPIQ